MISFLCVLCMLATLWGAIEDSILLYRRSIGRRQFLVSLASAAAVWALCIWILMVRA